MFCSNCGKQISDGAKFCSNCGTPVELAVVTIPEPISVTPKESPVAETEKVLPAIETEAPAEEVQPMAAGEFVPGIELEKFRMIEKYTGTSSLASGLGTGTLHVYDNGLQFVGILGASVGSGLLGAIASAAINISEAYDPNTYPLDQIQELRVGKRLAVYNTLVICMKNGDVWSFCPAVPGSSVPKLIIALLKPYMQN